jgi:hypothetical protein
MHCCPNRHRLHCHCRGRRANQAERRSKTAPQARDVIEKKGAPYLREPEQSDAPHRTTHHVIPHSHSITPPFLLNIVRQCSSCSKETERGVEDHRWCRCWCVSLSAPHFSTFLIAWRFRFFTRRRCLPNPPARVLCART